VAPLSRDTTESQEATIRRLAEDNMRSERMWQNNKRAVEANLKDGLRILTEEIEGKKWSLIPNTAIQILTIAHARLTIDDIEKKEWE
jgi:hypothetical protein